MTTTSPPPAPELTYAVIVGSVRKERLSRTIAEAMLPLLPDGGAVDLIDLAECPMPDDGLLEPGGGSTRSPIADRIAAADAFVVVTPEYNRSFPAALKQAIDWHYTEWMFKPATVVSYGVRGGVIAGEQLRGVLAELSVVTTRRAVGLAAPWQQLGETGYAPDPGTTDAARAAFTELAWWATTLRTARQERPFRG